ncbi:MAG: Holliday junction resolvase RuvX, partial [Gemmatimonadota bacterium]
RPLTEELAALVAERGVERVVIGIPFTLAGDEGPAARATREFAVELAGALTVPVEEWDERLTTEAARRALRDSGRSESDMKERVDQVAAVLLLEGYLRSRASEPETA